MKLTNSFHNTTATVRKTIQELEQIEFDANCAHPKSPEARAAKAYIRRIHKKLCGSPTCTCGNTFGAR